MESPTPQLGALVMLSTRAALTWLPTSTSTSSPSSAPKSALAIGLSKWIMPVAGSFFRRLIVTWSSFRSSVRYRTRTVSPTPIPVEDFEPVNGWMCGPEILHPSERRPHAWNVGSLCRSALHHRLHQLVQIAVPTCSLRNRFVTCAQVAFHR